MSTVFWPGLPAGSASTNSPGIAGQPYFLGLECNDAITGDERFGPYTFSLQSGSLPPGILLTPPNGPFDQNQPIALQGTPTVPGTYTSVWKATDQLGSFATGTIVISVYATQVAQQIAIGFGNNPLVMPGATIADAYSFTLTDDYGTAALATVGLAGVPPYTYVETGTFPVDFGISLVGNVFTAISVVSPTGIGTSSSTRVSVTDSIGQNSGAAFNLLTLYVQPQVKAIALVGSPGPGAVGVFYDDSNIAWSDPNVSSPSGPQKKLTITAGSLPPGLSITPTGFLRSGHVEIFGTPTADGTYGFTFTIEDTFGQITAYSTSVVIPGGTQVFGSHVGFMTPAHFAGGTK